MAEGFQKRIDAEQDDADTVSAPVSLGDRVERTWEPPGEAEARQQPAWLEPISSWQTQQEDARRDLDGEWGPGHMVLEDACLNEQPEWVDQWQTAEAAAAEEQPEWPAQWQNAEAAAAEQEPAWFEPSSCRWPTAEAAAAEVLGEPWNGEATATEAMEVPWAEAKPAEAKRPRGAETEEAPQVKVRGGKNRNHFTQKYGKHGWGWDLGHRPRGS